MKKNSIFSNAIYLFIGNVLVRVLTAASTILIARYLGAEDYGILSIALAYASVAAYFTDLGLTHTLIREGTKNNSSISVLMSSFFRVRILLSLLTILVSVLIVEGMYQDGYFKQILYMVLILTILGATFQGVGAAYYQLVEKMHLTAIIRTIAGITTAASLIAGMIFKWPLMYIAPVYGVANIVAGIISIILVMRRINIFKGWDKNILNGLGSFTISGLTIMLLPQIGPIVIEKASNLTEAGLFSAAYRIPSLLYQIPGVVAAAFYPVFFRLGNNNELDKHLELNIKQLKIMSFLGFIMATPFIFYSEWWVLFLFGEKWIEAALPLSILSFMVILQSFNFPMADAITTKGMQSKRTIVQFGALLTGLLAYFVLSAKYGSVGGAIAAVLIESFLFLGFSIFHGNSLKLLTKGSIRVIGSFILVVLIYFLFSNFSIHPLIGTTILCIFFIILNLGMDSELRFELKKRASKLLFRK